MVHERNELDSLFKNRTRTRVEREDDYRPKHGEAVLKPSFLCTCLQLWPLTKPNPGQRGCKPHHQDPRCPSFPGPCDRRSPQQCSVLSVLFGRLKWHAVAPPFLGWSNGEKSAPAGAVKLWGGRDCGGVLSKFIPMKVNDVHGRQHNGFGWTMADVWNSSECAYCDTLLRATCTGAWPSCFQEHNHRQSHRVQNSNSKSHDKQTNKKT